MSKSIAWLLLVFAAPLFAQSTSTILGIVKDSSGAVVAGATVTVQNTDTAQARTVTTSDDGGFRIPALQAGHYSVKVERAGFKTATRPDLTLDVAQELAINMALEVGASTQEIVVNEQAPQVDTSSSSLGGLVNDQEIADLPSEWPQLHRSQPYASRCDQEYEPRWTRRYDRNHLQQQRCAYRIQQLSSGRHFHRECIRMGPHVTRRFNFGR